MKVILDEGVPEGLEPYLTGCAVSTVRREGWKAIKNGALLELVGKAGFEAFVTNDKRMEREQQFHHRPFAILLLSTNHWPTLEMNAEKVRAALDIAKPGQVLKVACGRFVPKRFRAPF